MSMAYLMGANQGFVLLSLLPDYPKIMFLLLGLSMPSGTTD